jgi:thiamine transporter
MIECALMIALATVLSYIPLFSMPWGGSITLCSMAPLVIISLRHGVKWGVGTGLVHGLLQMMLGFQNVLYCQTIGAMILCVLLDYVVAYGVMGLACLFTRPFPNKSAGYTVGVIVTGLLRLLCSFLSGILIWQDYAPEGMPVALYSIQYNAGYMLPEIAITVVSALAIMRVLDHRAPKSRA